jgi:hypothetical protein
MVRGDTNQGKGEDELSNCDSRLVLLLCVLASARDSSGKPAVERLAERGLVADSPVALSANWRMAMPPINILLFREDTNQGEGLMWFVRTLTTEK